MKANALQMTSLGTQWWQHHDVGAFLQQGGGACEDLKQDGWS